MNAYINETFQKFYDAINCIFTWKIFYGRFSVLSENQWKLNSKSLLVYKKNFTVRRNDLISASAYCDNVLFWE